jgi:hypothetical protein
VRCPACGAHNPTDAAWCGQCFGPLADAPPPAVARPPADVAPGTDRPPGGQAPETTAEPAPADDRPVRTRGGEVEWRCATCGGWSPLVAPSCPVCGSLRHGFEVAASPSRATPDLPRAVLVTGTVLVPGLGHLLAGRTGTGIARSVLALLWGIAGLALLGGDARAAGGSLLLGWAVLLVASLIDLPAPGDVRPREVLSPRRLALLVAVVTGALLLSLAVVAPVTAG